MTMKISKLREAKGMTQSEFGAALGVAQNTVSCWEHETMLPRARQLPDIAKLLGCSIDELFEEGAHGNACI